MRSPGRVKRGPWGAPRRCSLGSLMSSLGPSSCPGWGPSGHWVGWVPRGLSGQGRGGGLQEGSGENPACHPAQPTLHQALLISPRPAWGKGGGLSGGQRWGWQIQTSISTVMISCVLSPALGVFMSLRRSFYSLSLARYCCSLSLVQRCTFSSTLMIPKLGYVL